jgi:hypothetical protein
MPTQATERRLPSLFKNMKTLPFNGDGDQVATMYAGIEPKKLYWLLEYFTGLSYLQARDGRTKDSPW